MLSSDGKSPRVYLRSFAANSEGPPFSCACVLVLTIVVVLLVVLNECLLNRQRSGSYLLIIFPAYIASYALVMYYLKKC